METVNIYLSGGMGNKPFEEQVGWRNELIEKIKQYTDDFGKGFNYSFFNPPYYYSPVTENHKSEKEAMEFDLYKLRKADVVVVNFNVPKSIGTAMELMLAKEYNIPIIAFNYSDDIHPWLKTCCTRICESLDEVVNHISNFYLN